MDGDPDPGKFSLPLLTCSLDEVVFCSLASYKEFTRRWVRRVGSDMAGWFWEPGTCARRLTSRHRGVCTGSEQIKWLRLWKDELVAFCHPAEHLHISSHTIHHQYQQRTLKGVYLPSDLFGKTTNRMFLVTSTRPTHGSRASANSLSSKRFSIAQPIR